MATRTAGALEVEGLVNRASQPAEDRISLVSVSDGCRAWGDHSRHRSDVRLAALSPAERNSVSPAVHALDGALEHRS